MFGHSDSHVALQVADILASAVLFPAACSAYCQALTWNQHIHPGYDQIRAQFGPRLKALQYRYFDPSLQVWRGGIYPTGPTGGLAPTLLAPPASLAPKLPFAKPTAAS